MKLLVYQWLVVSSLLAGSLGANGETRPQYGGTVRMMMRAAPTSLDPADRAQPPSLALRSVTAMIFEGLVTIDEGRVKGGLAESWQATRGNQQWQFRLRRNVKFHDGTPLDSNAAAASLRFANPTWNVRPEGDTVVIETRTPINELLSELALARNAIVKRDADGKLNGTGPFHIAEWQSARRVKLDTEENNWRGRPFLEGVEIEFGRSFRDQAAALQSGKVDLVEVAPEQAHRVPQDGRRLVSSSPMELLALVFDREASSADEKLLRDALAWSLERVSMRDVLLQGDGQASGSILPTWMSGYGFVFSSAADLPRARQLRAQVHNVPNWKIGYDGNDATDRLLAERIALNGKDAGLSLQPTSSTGAELKVARIPLASMDPWIALRDLAVQLGLPSIADKDGSIEDLYGTEQGMLATRRIVPLFHVPGAYASVSNLKNWQVRADGSLGMSDAWLESARP